MSSQPVVSHNIFSALAASKKPKATKKEEEKVESEAPKVSTEELDRAVFSASAIDVSNWADDSEEEDDGFAAPPAGGFDAGAGWNEVRRCIVRRCFRR